MATLYVMSGLPGCGKTTYCKHNKDLAIHISRDEIRFSLLKEGDEYFSHEKLVQKLFWEKINRELENGNNVFADQTSLTVKSRKWLLKHITTPCEKILVQFHIPLETCLDRNKLREGAKCVPSCVIENMYETFEECQPNENFDKVLVIKE